MDKENSESSNNAVIYIFSDAESLSERWEPDYLTETEEMVARIEHEVTSSPILIAGRIMTTGSLEEEMITGPSSAVPKQSVTPKFDGIYFDEKLCYAPPKGNSKGESSCARHFSQW